MSDRAVSLDLRTLAGDAGSLAMRGNNEQPAGGDAADELVQRFQAALSSRLASEPQDTPSAHPSPFSLLRELAAQPGTPSDTAPADTPDPTVAVNDDTQATTIAPEPVPLTTPGSETRRPVPVQAPYEPLMQMVAESASRMMVGNGDRGTRQVRIDIAEDTLPGVTVAVYQAAGEWVAQFTCTNPDSFTTLAHPAPEMAQSLADTLQAPACWLVEMDPPEQHPVEARALPSRGTST
jgi:hypothetical protein